MQYFSSSGVAAHAALHLIRPRDVSCALTVFSRHLSSQFNHQESKLPTAIAVYMTAARSHCMAPGLLGVITFPHPPSLSGNALLHARAASSVYELMWNFELSRDEPEGNLRRTPLSYLHQLTAFSALTHLLPPEAHPSQPQCQSSRKACTPYSQPDICGVGINMICQRSNHEPGTPCQLQCVLHLVNGDHVTVRISFLAFISGDGHLQGVNAYSGDHLPDPHQAFCLVSGYLGQKAKDTGESGEDHVGEL